MDKNENLTTEEVQKKKSHSRVTVLLIVINILLVAYLIFQISTVFNS